MTIVDEDRTLEIEAEGMKASTHKLRMTLSSSARVKYSFAIVYHGIGAFWNYGPAYENFKVVANIRSTTSSYVCGTHNKNWSILRH